MAQASYQHQDWTTIVFRKSTNTNSQNTQSSTKQPTYKSKLDEDGEEFANKKFDKEYINTVIQKRTEKKITQKQLAQIINVEQNIIQRFEQGKEVYDHTLKSKLNKALGISKT